MSQNIPERDIYDLLDVSFATQDEQRAESIGDLTGIEVTMPRISATELREKLIDKRAIRLSHISRHYDPKENDIDGDWVTFGAVISKSTQSSKATGNAYTILKLSDLRDLDNYVSLFLFGESHSVHWKIMVGTVVGVLNPVFMPQKNDNKYQGPSKELHALKLDYPMKLLNLGESKHMGRCKAVLRSGEVCNSITNVSLSEFCAYHVTQHYKKAASGRHELKATYQGIEPKKQFKEALSDVAIDSSSSFSCPLLAPTSQKTLKELSLKVLDRKRRLDEEVDKIEFKVSGSKRRKLTEEEIEQRKRKQAEFDHRRELEREVIKKQLRNPVTLAARNLHAAYMKNSCPIAINRNDKVKVTEFKTAQDIFDKLPPRPQQTEHRQLPAPKLGAGLKSGDVIDLQTGRKCPRKVNAQLAEKLKQTLITHRVASNIKLEEVEEVVL